MIQFQLQLFSDLGVDVDNVLLKGGLLAYEVLP